MVSRIINHLSKVVVVMVVVVVVAMVDVVLVVVVLMYSVSLFYRITSVLQSGSHLTSNILEFHFKFPT